MILVRNLRLLPGEPAEMLKSLAAKKLRIKETEITGLHLTKRSLDARKKNDIHYVCACAVKVSGDEEKIIARAKSPDVSKYEKIEYAIPRVEPPVLRPVVVGFGPAGMFAALVLALAMTACICVAWGLLLIAVEPLINRALERREQRRLARETEEDRAIEEYLNQRCSRKKAACPTDHTHEN